MLQKGGRLSQQQSHCVTGGDGESASVAKPEGPDAGRAAGPPDAASEAPVRFLLRPQLGGQELPRFVAGRHETSFQGRGRRGRLRDCHAAVRLHWRSAAANLR